MAAIVVILLVLALCALPLVCGSLAELVHRSRRPW
jgi:hypothetical protein